MVLTSAGLEASGSLGELLCAALRCDALEPARSWASAAALKLHGSSEAFKAAKSRSDLQTALKVIHAME